MIADIQIVLRLIIATLLGGLIGLEREKHGRAAGLRTHILVCVGSALIMLTSIYISTLYKGITSADPARIAAGVVTGIGFLGAGTIIRFGASVRGLTTAASLWAVAGLGLAVGCGFYSGAFVASALILITLFLLTGLERGLIRKDWYKVISVETKGDIQQLKDVKRVFSDYRAEIRDFELKKSKEGNVIFEINLKLPTTKNDDQIISRIMNINGVEKVKWE